MVSVMLVIAGTLIVSAETNPQNEIKKENCVLQNNGSKELELTKLCDEITCDDHSPTSIEKHITQNGNNNNCEKCGNSIISIDNSIKLDTSYLCHEETSCDSTVTKEACGKCDRTCPYNNCESCDACGSTCSDTTCETCGTCDHTCTNNDCATSNCPGQAQKTFIVRCCEFLAKCFHNLNCIQELIQNLMLTLGLM